MSLLKAARLARSGFGVLAMLSFGLLVAFVSFERADAQETQPEFINCAPVAGYEFALVAEERISLDDWRGNWRTGCWYRSTAVDETGQTAKSELLLEALWASPPGNETVEQWFPDGPTGIVTTFCSDVDEFADGIGLTASTDRAVRVAYKFRESHLDHDPEVGKAAANALREIVAPFAASCEGVEIIRRADYFTPLPEYLQGVADVLQAAPTAPVTSAPATTATPTTTEATTTTEAAGPAVSNGGESSGDAGLSLGLKGLGFVLLGLSVVGLLWTLRGAGKEKRVRPKLDTARVIIISVVAIATTILLAHTPPWAIAAGVGLGAILGWMQGRNVTLRTDGPRTFEKRKVIAIFAFAVGLVVSQGAGLLNRTGVIGIGVGVSFLSAAIAASLIAARSKPLRLARAGGASAAVAIVATLGLVSIAVGALAQESADTDRAAGIVETLTEAVAWDSIEITGGLYANEGKPLATISVAPRFSEPPVPLTRTVEWVYEPPGGSSSLSRSVTETFSFTLNGDGGCCTIGYEGEGIAEALNSVSSTTVASGVLGDFQAFGLTPVQRFGSTYQGPELPFGPVQKLNLGTPDEACRRPVVEPLRGSEAMWNKYEVDGQPQESFRDLYAEMYTTCDIPGFDVESAQAVLPSVPAADSARRDIPFADTTGTGCPVYQEAFSKLYSPTMDGAPTEEVRRLYLEPNGAACSSSVVVGEEGPGGVRSELFYSLATDDPETEARRSYEAAELSLRSRPFHEVPETSRCDVSALGFALPPIDGQGCAMTTHHRLGDGWVTITTDYESSDGPNVIAVLSIPGVGSTTYRCHHCDASSPEIPRIIEAVVTLLNDGVIDLSSPDFTPEDPDAAPSVSSADDGDSATSDNVIDLLSDDADESALWAVIIGLIGTIGIGVTRVAEDKLDRNEPPTVFKDPHQVDGTLTVRPDGMVWWPHAGPDSGWVTPEEAVILIAEEEKSVDGLDEAIRTRHDDRVAAGRTDSAARREAEEWIAAASNDPEVDVGTLIEMLNEVHGQGDDTWTIRTRWPELYEEWMGRAGGRAGREALDHEVEKAKTRINQAAAPELYDTLDELLERIAAKDEITQQDLDRIRILTQIAEGIAEVKRDRDASDWARIEGNEQAVIETAWKVAATLVDPTGGVVTGVVWGAVDTYHETGSLGQAVANGAWEGVIVRVGNAIGTWQRGRDAIGTVGWSAVGGGIAAAGETAARGGSWDQMKASVTVGVAMGGMGGIVEDAMTATPRPPPDVPTVRVPEGRSGADWSRPGGPRTPDVAGRRPPPQLDPDPIDPTMGIPPRDPVSGGGALEPPGVFDVDDIDYGSVSDLRTAPPPQGSSGGVPPVGPDAPAPISGGSDTPDVAGPRPDPAPTPTRDLTPEELLEQARGTKTPEEIVASVEDQPDFLPRTDGVDPTPPSSGIAGVDVDDAGRVAINGRQIGNFDADSQTLTNMNGDQIQIATDGMGVPVGYLEVPDAPPGMTPTYNSEGKLAGYVDDMGRANIDGELVPVGVDSDGNLVPFEEPPVSHLNPEHDAPADIVAGSPAPGEAEPAGFTPYGNPVASGDSQPPIGTRDLDTRPRVPVLDENNQVIHYVESGPREIHYDSDGNPQFVQRQFPPSPEQGLDLDIGTGQWLPDGQPMPGLEVADSGVLYPHTEPLTGPDAPPSAPEMGPK